MNDSYCAKWNVPIRLLGAGTTASILAINWIKPIVIAVALLAHVQTSCLDISRSFFPLFKDNFEKPASNIGRPGISSAEIPA